MHFFKRYWVFLLIIAVLLYLVISLLAASIDRGITKMYDDLSIHSLVLTIEQMGALIHYDWLGLDRSDAFVKMNQIIERYPDLSLFIKEESTQQVYFSEVMFCFENERIVDVVTGLECSVSELKVP